MSEQRVGSAGVVRRNKWKADGASNKSVAAAAVDGGKRKKSTRSSNDAAAAVAAEAAAAAASLGGGGGGGGILARLLLRCTAGAMLEAVKASVETVYETLRGTEAFLAHISLVEDDDADA